MVDVFEVANLLIEKSLKDHKDEIDMIACYGSQARGDARKNSDLDVFYTPADGKNPPVNKTFLLKGVLFDFWGLSWKTLEGFATGTIRGWAFAPALVNQAKILYARSEIEHQRLQKLKDKIKELKQPEARPYMIKRAVNHFSTQMFHLVNLEKAAAKNDITSIKYSAWKIMEAIWECLSLANQVYFEKGLASSLKDVSHFKNKPNDMDLHVSAIITSRKEKEIVSSCKILINETRQILRDMQLYYKQQLEVQVCFKQFYPEMKDLVTKILADCKKGDHIKACTNAMILHKEVMQALCCLSQNQVDSSLNTYREMSKLYEKMGFPDLMNNNANDLSSLESKVLLLDEKMRAYLKENSVELCEFDSLQKLEKIF